MTSELKNYVRAIVRYQGMIRSENEAEIREKIEKWGGPFVYDEGGVTAESMRTIVYTFMTFRIARDAISVLQNWGYWVEIYEPGGLKRQYAKKRDCRLTQKQKWQRHK